MRIARIAPLALALGLAACSGGTAPTDVSETTTATSTGPLSRAFAESAAKNHVPVDLLIAIAATEGGLEMPLDREVEVDAKVPAAGPLMLRHGKLDTLKRGAELMGTAELDLRQHADVALEAGARVLAEIGARTGAREADVASWYAAVEELSGYADDDHRREYAHRVFALLARGGELPGRDGETMHVAPLAVPETLRSKIELVKPTVPEGADLGHTMGADYAGAEWIPTSCSGKCDAGRGGASVQFVVIHDTEGGWDASVATLQNDPGKSVHYIVGTDGRVGQFVNETVTAWHAGNYWYNQRSIGIEHVGYSTKPYPEKQYAVSAKLVDYLTKKYSVKKDRAHVIGHDQIPNGTKIAQSSAPCSDSPRSCEGNTNYGGAGHHTDPGVWEWCLYMPRFGGTCKCNDIWELWNCSADKTKAFRCTSGKIEIDTCDAGCEVMPLGTPDVCHHEEATPDAGPADTGPADAAPEDTGTGDRDAGAFEPRDANAADDAGPPPEALASTDLEGGCSTIPGAAGASAGLVLVATLAAMGLARRRRE